MSKTLYKNDSDFSCLGIILLIALLIFAGPAVVMIGWNMFAAGMFGAPTMTYWTAFWATNAIQVLFGAKNVSKNS